MPSLRSAVTKLLIIQGCLIGLACIVFLTGINWGLPSAGVDRYLFDKRTPWTGKEIISLAGPWTPAPSRGADVDVNPLDRTRLQILNDTDAKRAEIVRRYHLYSYQPDEMITFRALAQMNPAKGRLDPRLYQYGGLWIYPVGAILKLGSMFGFVTLTSDLAFYLDHPESFARFYILARAYSATWGVIGALAVFHIARKFTPSLWIAAAAACAFIFTPAVVNLAHEAKPHLPAAVLMLLAVLAAFRFLRTGTTRDAVLTGALCGAAAGMVISAVLIFAMLPVMSAIRARWSASPRRHLIITGAATASGALVYVLANPFFIINFIRRDPALSSNLSNSTAMYHPVASSGAFATSAWLIFEAASPFAASAGIIAGLILLRRVRREAFLFLVPIALILVQFVALAAGKTGEYARFALFPEIALSMLAILGMTAIFRRRFVQALICGFILLTQCYHSFEYVKGFRLDSGPFGSRWGSATDISYMRGRGNKLLVEAEPAPYILPPVDLFHWQLLLPPRDGTISPDAYTASVRTLVWRQATPMSWANIFFVISENPAPPLTGDLKVR